MRTTEFDPDSMPILDLDMSATSPYEAHHYLDSPELMAAYLDESSKYGNEATAHALRQIAKAKARLSDTTDEQKKTPASRDTGVFE